ncbi:N-acetylneuraminate synthase [Pseudomonadales bacterium]|nr:N-acetylneuraminate synthase [Pseudomonadales bacterium]
MTLIIAEAGVNHNGDEDLAFKLVDVAFEAGADIVKFQTFKASNVLTAAAEQADYQISNTKRKESQLAMLSRLELSFDFHLKLVEHCKNVGIEFLSTAFDSESLNFLVNDLKLKKLKIPSGDLTNSPLLLKHAQTGSDLIVSTGMASLAEIEMALGVIAFGFVATETKEPSVQAFEDAYFSGCGQAALREKVTLLHCTTEYPAPLRDINLAAMETMSKAFKLPVGYSDHSAGIHVPIVAAAFGAQIVEKHFTLDRAMTGPDHKASLAPGQLAEMIRGIRDIELAIGDGIKGPRHSEIKNRPVARKSLVAQQSISKGDVFSERNLAIKRPGLGMSPTEYWGLLGREASQDYQFGDLINE